MRQRLSFLILCIFASFFAQAQSQEEKQNQFDVDINIRPRAEYRNGFKTPLFKDEKSATFVNQRSRLSLQYQRSDNLSAALSLQNVSVWGEYPITNVKNNNVAIFEAWAQFKTDEGLFVKFGRQVLNYDDGRFLSGLDWHQAARSHDALKFGYQTTDHQLDLMFAYNQDEERASGGTYYGAFGVPYKTMQTLYYQNKMIAGFTPSFMFINVGLEEGNVATGESKLANMQTVGTNLIYKPISEFSLQGNVFYQMGKRRFFDEKISAYMLTLRGDYNVSSKFSLNAGTDYLSGEDHGVINGKDTYNAFNTLYGGYHARFGVMDMVIASPYRAGMNLGVWSKFIGVNYRPIFKLNLGLTYFHLSTAADVYDSGSDLTSNLGSEIDFLLDYDIMKNVKLSFGYATFFGTPTMDFVKGGDHKVWQDWAFLSVTVNPRVFSSKW